ncbi:MAG: DUF1887 family CARF protein [Betaproteobacteria bacterium]|nr:DUF1887 family CARF protein [Betaproteobacteria bacterium]
MNTQICLVSAQAAANLLPALDGSLKPEKVVLVVTAKMQRQANNLSQVLRENSIKVELLKLGNEHNFHQIANELLELAAQLEGEDVALNITGGTKLMSIAAQRVAETSGWRMFYVDADTDQVIWLGRDETSPQPLEQQLRLRHYLQSYGFSFTKKPDRAQPMPVQQELTQTLSLNVGNLEDAISILNALAQDAENRRSLSVQLNDWQCDSLSLDVLLRDFENAQALQRRGHTIHFGSEAQRDFVKGGWLELHAIQAVHQVTGSLGIRDKAVGLEVIDDASKTRSELDIAFMARNRLFIIECKTARIDKPQGSADRPAPPKANDTLFKLSENCRRIGGLGTRGMLLSYRKLREPELQLASALNIQVVTGADIARLPEKLKHWVTHSV